MLSPHLLLSLADTLLHLGVEGADSETLGTRCFLLDLEEGNPFFCWPPPTRVLRSAILQLVSAPP